MERAPSEVRPLRGKTCSNSFAHVRKRTLLSILVLSISFLIKMILLFRLVCPLNRENRFQNDVFLVNPRLVKKRKGRAAFEYPVLSPCLQLSEFLSIVRGHSVQMPFLLNHAGNGQVILLIDLIRNRTWSERHGRINNNQQLLYAAERKGSRKK